MYSKSRQPSNRKVANSQLHHVFLLLHIHSHARLARGGAVIAKDHHWTSQLSDVFLFPPRTTKHRRSATHGPRCRNERKKKRNRITAPPNLPGRGSLIVSLTCSQGKDPPNTPFRPVLLGLVPPFVFSTYTYYQRTGATPTTRLYPISWFADLVFPSATYTWIPLVGPAASPAAFVPSTSHVILHRIRKIAR